ncbi:MAG: rod-binding protein [Alphaproteobacteria bacterium]|nr:MAG: rod-binding protein [Alphaproteobacteria bacterium]
MTSVSAASPSGTAPPSPKALAKANATAKDFEAMVLAQMLAPMWETVEVDPDFGGGHAEETMRSVMVQEYGKAMAQSGGVGIAASVHAEILRLQEAKSQPAVALAPHSSSLTTR